jgi:predicted enzyme related to lactoylglutathione lyase
VVARAAEAGGTPGAAEDFVYGRMATITDPFGAEFSVIARPGVSAADRSGRSGTR